MKYLIEFLYLNTEHIDRYIIIELINLLDFYDIKNKVYSFITNNISNNKILKKELYKAPRL